MACLLLIEDEPDLRELVAHHATAAGHRVLACSHGLEGLRLAAHERPDLVLLDLMLPDLPGIEVCKRLRSDPATARLPVLMLTARAAEPDRVQGFEAGADDYVVKPFSSRELLLRVSALLRRSEAQPAGPRTPDLPIALDHSRHEARVHGRKLRLTALEFKLLSVLVERRDRVLTREELLRDVWEVRPDLQTRTVDTHVKRLRERLGDAGHLIRTIRGVGYSLRPDGGDAP